MKKLITLYHQLTAIFMLGVVSAMETVAAINIEVPPSQGQEDVAITGPTRITGDESEVYDFIGVLNEYLWFTITVITFGALLYAGIRLMTTTGGKQEGLTVTLNVIKGAAIGILLSIFSYLLVRLIINIL